ncbi:MAG: 16S rRNA (uracil(1498)-N(3))-methyltransferase [Elusimicrobia bacterium]|nr:16S rRNA (uracil(1498)-N(3))-methyltransferase [Elusimicrobiota bacterium]
MPQFFVPKKNIQSNSFFFEPSESHHIARVLRKKTGDLIQIFDGKGWVGSARITETSNSNKVIGELLPSFKNDCSDPAFEKNYSCFSLHLYPALIQNSNFEWMIQKVTEIGVDSIQPILTERTQIHFSPEKSKAKITRWEKIILSAAKQSGRKTLPDISTPLSLKEALKKIKKNEPPHPQEEIQVPIKENRHDLKIILWEGEEKISLSKVLHQTQSFQKSKIHVFIGPEGGFTIEEIHETKEHGVLAVTIGNNILRAETASLAASSFILLHAEFP